MTAEIIELAVPTTAPHAPDDILEKAKGQGFEDVIVIGTRSEKRMWVGGSNSDVERNLIMLEYAKRFLMDSVMAQERELPE